MKLSKMHPEDVKAAIRKRFATVAAFERRFNLPSKSVHDLLRGRPSARVEEAINSVISKPYSEISKSEHSEYSQNVGTENLLNDDTR